MQDEAEIISFLTKENILGEDILQDVIKKQQDTGQSVIDILKEDELVGDDALAKVIVFSNGVEFVTLSPEMIDPMAAQMVSYETVNRNNLIPVKKEGNKLYVAMASPLNLAIRDQIEAKTGCQVVPLYATGSAIRQAVMYHFNVGNVTRQDIVSLRLKQSPSEKSAGGRGKFRSSNVADAPVTRLVSSIINGAIDGRASDIHIEPQEYDVRVRYRVDGILHDAIEIPSSVQQGVISHIKILTDMDISEHRMPQDGHLTVQFHDKEYDLRVSSLPSVGGEKIVMRILDKSAGLWAFDDIVTSATDNKKLKELISNPYGMILLTGPTGSGKTTTLYSVLQSLNTPEKNIVTVEDPVEYRLNGVTQVQVNPVAGLTFANGLRSIVRQDPDIIFVGEIRDLETAEIAISAALTGHLVLSTLHTNDAVGAVSRLVNIGVQPFLVASALLGAVAQRLVRTCCDMCKQTYEPSQEELKILRDLPDKNQDIKLHRSRGCNTCYHTGYYGRKAIYEILSITPEIRRMIVAGCGDDEIRAQAGKEGMRTLKESGIEEVLAGNWEDWAMLL
ncbi:MAG: GspE/PulE family protein [Planctomycetota bacterium]|jgi:type IV pilus assembly protein PilB